HDALQTHCLLARVLRAPSAVGGKPGRAGPLPFAVLLPNVAAQTRASQPPLGLRFPGVSGTAVGVLCSWSSCQCIVGCHYDQDEEPFHPISMVVLSRCALVAYATKVRRDRSGFGCAIVRWWKLSANRQAGVQALACHETR